MPLPLRKLGAAPPSNFPQRAKGCLLGLSVGDAFGTTVKGRRLIAPMFPTLVDGVHTEMKGRGPHDVRPGQVTANGQMAAALALSLRELGRFDAEDVRKRYLQWLPHAIGPPLCLQEVLGMVPAHQASRIYWVQSSRRAASNASLVRTAPIAVLYAKSDDERLTASFEDSALTHFDPRCQLACAAFNYALAASFQARQPKPMDVMLAAETGIAIGSARLARLMPEVVRDTQDASEMLRRDLEAAQRPDPLLFGPELHMHQQEDYVRVAFRLAFWELLHAPSFEAGVLDTVNRGGDSDTNGAVTGALLGAFYGADAIPARWSVPVLEALGMSRGPLKDLYHPTQMLLLVPST